MKPSRILKNLLVAVVAIALAWNFKTAAKIIGTRPMPRKNHGYLATSSFRTGFDTLRNRLQHDPIAAIEPWQPMNSRKSKSARVV